LDCFSVVDLLADGLVVDEVLALVSCWSAGSLSPLGGDGGSDEVGVVFLSSSGDADAFSGGASSGEGSSDARA
jgi:hypothetical protein